MRDQDMFSSIIEIDNKINKLDDKMTSKIDTLNTILSKHDLSLNQIENRLDKYNLILEYHIKRTESNEKMIEEFKKFQYKAVGAILSLSCIIPVFGWILDKLI